MIGLIAPSEMLGDCLLTVRECAVLKLIADGRTTKQVAADLGVSTKTVETHRAHIMDKLERHSIAELVKYAVLHGLSALE